jgi:alpha-galactosidase
MIFRTAAFAALLFLAPAAALAQSASQSPAASIDALAPTPPMGWNSWNHFACNVSEQLIRSAADQLVASGMRDAGYKYIVIDDCWHGARDAAGNIQPDPQRFPSGIKALADYVHSKGLKFGIYSDAGTKTCAGRPGSRGHEFQDAAQYAAWGVDYLKYDWCNTSTQNAQASYAIMHDALLASGRPIVFSLCEWGTAKPWLWAAGIGNLWRTTGDIGDLWEGKQEYRLGVMNILDLQAPLASFAGPGHWNDPDMLEVGNGGMTDAEYRAHFSLWAMLAAPLMAGNDLGHMTPATREILTNREVIAVDQDPLGHEGTRVAKDGALEVWARPLAGGSRAVILLNRDTQPHPITVRWTDLNYPDSLEANVRDLWQHKDLGRVHGAYTATVPPHAVVMLSLKP